MKVRALRAHDTETRIRNIRIMRMNNLIYVRCVDVAARECWAHGQGGDSAK